MARDRAKQLHVLSSINNGVTTLTMNRPAKLNGWTVTMMQALREALTAAAQDDETKAVILTGSGRYYCAGVNLGGTIQFGHPQSLHEQIVAHNRDLFGTFLEFPKPILAAVNGPVIGAATTSATLCDGLIAAHEATFSTPFARLGITPEGCSSVLFAKLMGDANAIRMLGPEGWQPTAQEALDAGLAQWAVPGSELAAKAQEVAETWVREGRTRTFRGGCTRDELKRVNELESVDLASSFLGAPFMKAQFKFLWGKRKHAPALMFLGLWASRPLWKRMLSPEIAAFRPNA